MKCPICLEKYTLISVSQSVCDLHQNWLITTCSVCGVVSFSDCKGLCMQHGKADIVSTVVGSHDPTWYLKRIGQEGEPNSGI